MSVLKLRYKNYGPRVYRPVIPVVLEYQGRTVGYEVLVDSGADNCIFHAEIGELLGINMRSGEECAVYGITGVPKPYYLHNVTVKIGGWPRQMNVGFLEGMTTSEYGVVGQKGFFELFIVKFDLLKKEIELKQRLLK